MNQLILGILDNRGVYATYELNVLSMQRQPDPKYNIEMIVEHHMRKYRESLTLDLLVTYEQSLRNYTHKYFEVDALNDAVNFLIERDKIKFEEDSHE